MRVLILTHGSRGDIQPFVALGAALIDAGHETTLVAPASSRSFAQGYGMKVLEFEETVETLLADPDIRQGVETGFRGLKGRRMWLRCVVEYRRMMAYTLDRMASAAEQHPCDVVVHHASLPGHEIAEKLDVPGVPTALGPYLVPTDAFPYPHFPLKVPRCLNRSTYWYSEVQRRLLQGDVNAWRRNRLGLPPRSGHRNTLRTPRGAQATVLQAFSKHLLPAQLDYPESVNTTGFWFLPTNGECTPSELLKFLDAGEAPVCISFGSFASGNPRRTTRIMTDAIKQAQVRAIIVGGWGGVEPDILDTDVFYTREAPFDQLFSRASAVVHHGGAGTTALALAAGRPQVLCPFIYDQNFYAERVHQLGLAPAPLPQSQLRADALASAITTVLRDGVSVDRAKRTGRAVRDENGVQNAVRTLEELVVNR